MVGKNDKSSFSTKCLMWQYEEIMRSPLEGVNAAPLESNIFEWHGNFYFNENHEHFPGMVLHFILNLPTDYPNSTPDMQLLTYFPHSHVFGGTICFSLLSQFQWWFSSEGLPETAFWNPSRSIRSLLESVYTFLTVDEDKHVSVTKDKARAAIQSSRSARCSCGHHPSSNKLWPPEEDWLASNNNSETEKQISSLAFHEDLAGKKPGSKRTAIAVCSKRTAPPAPPTKAVTVSISNIPNDASCSNLEFNTHIASLKKRAEGIHASTSEPISSVRLMDEETLGDFRCSITGVAFNQSENVVLGFGVNVERRERDKTILSITTDLMPITLEAFVKGKIRKSALGMKLTHFFPFAINERHWSKAKRVLPWCLDSILGGHKERNLSDNQDDKLLFVVGELWKSMAVLMMKGGTHASEKVLKGFCALHHILLLATEEADPLSGVAANLMEDEVVCEAESKTNEKLSISTDENDDKKQAAKPLHPKQDSWTVVVPRKKRIHNSTQTEHRSVLSLANERVRSFVRHPRGRHKAQCPDFGRFLPLLLLSDLKWREVQHPFVHELLARNARWIVKAHPELRQVYDWEYDKPSLRVTKSWDPSATGLKITAFQIWFVLNVHSWALSALPEPITDAYSKIGNNRLLLRAMYDTLGGRPTKSMMLRFQQETKSIEAMTKYEDFFQTVEMPVHGSLLIQRLLCDAMSHSSKCRYHR
mmetsp:Transcript_4517/g.6173  ORF Transcript_4517/g.6173 Transcript_4517/m.6173 type:complete len:703 (-) Transcript_4517:111-2219(-)